MRKMPAKKSKDDYKKELYSLKRTYKELETENQQLKDEIRTLQNNQEFLKKYAEKTGTEKNEIKRTLMLLEEKYERLESEYNNLKQINKGEKKNGKRASKRKPNKSTSSTRRK